MSEMVHCTWPRDYRDAQPPRKHILRTPGLRVVRLASGLWAVLAWQQTREGPRVTQLAQMGTEQAAEKWARTRLGLDEEGVVQMNSTG